MQTEDNLNQVWGKPVKSVHTLRDLAKLVAAQPQVQPVVSGKRVLTEEQKEALRQRAKLAREVLAEKRARGEVTYPKRGKYKERKEHPLKRAVAEEQKKWSHPKVTTSSKPVSVNLLTIDYITRMNFNYSIGRAVECIATGDLIGAMEHITRDIESRSK